jgi:hypothetical protein
MFPYFIILIFINLVFSFLLFKKRGGLNKITPLFLLLLFFIEIICYWRNSNGLPTIRIYNLWFPVEFSFYTILISYDFRTSKKFFYFVVLAYIITCSFFYSFAWDINMFFSIGYSLGVIMLLLVSFIKLGLILSSEIVINPFKNPFFWLAIGLILVNVLGFFLFSLYNYLNQTNKQLLEALKTLNVILTNIQYIAMLAYFVFLWKEKN